MSDAAMRAWAKHIVSDWRHEESDLNDLARAILTPDATLKPCPDCGGTVSAEEYDGLWCVACDELCGFGLHDDSFDSDADAMEAWNKWTRPAPPSETSEPVGEKYAKTMRVMQDDLRDILNALGLGDHARPASPHEVVRNEVLPALARLRSPAPPEGAREPDLDIVAATMMQTACWGSSWEDQDKPTQGIWRQAASSVLHKISHIGSPPPVDEAEREREHDWEMVVEGDRYNSAHRCRTCGEWADKERGNGPCLGHGPAHEAEIRKRAFEAVRDALPSRNDPPEAAAVISESASAYAKGWSAGISESRAILNRLLTMEGQDDA